MTPAIRRNPISDTSQRPAFRLALLAVFLISFSVLAFEVALTRVFSVMLSYHFVFAIVSGAMLGLGAGGLFFRRFARDALALAAWIGAVVFSVSLVGSVVLILTLPVYGSQSLAGLRFWLYAGVAVVPFAAAGFAVSGLFQSFSEKSSLLYGADLLGAAAGALVVVPAMDAFGAVKTVFLLAVVAALGALLLGQPRRRRAVLSLAALLLLGALPVASAITGRGIEVPIANDPAKEEYRLLTDPALDAAVIESRWSSFGRTDLVASDDLSERWIFVDGAAGSAMYDIDALRSDPEQRMQFAMHSGELFPFQFLTKAQKRSALILGPGGGRDVAVALLGGVKRITAVEVNPDVVEIMQEYEDINGGIYSGRPGVTAVVGEGRQYARTASRRFDLIMASIPVTKSSRSVEGYALTENNLFTVEAFRDYFDHLDSDGRLILVAHNDAEIYKLVSLALAAFEKQGIPEAQAMKHLYTVASDMMPAVVIQRRPLTVDQAQAIHPNIHELGFDKGALFIPWIEQQTVGPLRMLDQALVDVSLGSTTMDALVKAAPADLRPPTDDRPFFYKFERGLPSPFPAFGVLMAIFAATLLVLVTRRPKKGSDRRTFVGALRESPRLKTYLLLFSALGVGYMLIEIAFFQRLTLYMGQPQRALTVLLFSLLLGGGVGSILTTFLGRKGIERGAVIAVAVAALVVALVLLTPKAFATGVDARLGAVMLILPLGILLGCPFPLAMRSLRSHDLERHASVLWGVNAGASVLGSALAMILGITWGFSSALLTGAATYLAIAALFVALGAAKEANIRVADTARGRGRLESRDLVRTPDVTR